MEKHFQYCARVVSSLVVHVVVVVGDAIVAERDLSQKDD